MKRFTLLLIALMTLSLLLSSCSNNNNQTNNSGSATSASYLTPVEDTPSPDDDYNRDITIVQAQDLVSWDPVNTSDLWNGYIINNVYSKLFTFDDKINGVPELCKEYKRVSDTEWQFTIYTGVKNHDGTTLTIDDVVYSLNRTKNGTAIGALFKPVLAITKVNDDTLSITTDGPYPALPTALTHQACCIVPKHYSDVADADNWAHPIGSGRYKFESRTIGDSVKLVRFDDYFNRQDLALNKSLTFKIIPEGSNRTIAVETGAADLNIDFNTVDYNRVISNPKMKLWGIESQSV
ncbi:MAG: ABC transporter substrate-binding protein, partial [Oscillospiraceae bacterium]|nr:ABC transporter substrate-binding protein [Oscillospiraceae bacterium]